MTSKKLLDLGSFLVNDFVKEQPADKKLYSLDLYADPEFNAVRLGKGLVAPADSMWGKYWYRSGTNASMTNELFGIAKEVASRVKLKEGDVWVDIACNDGTMFKAIPDYVTKIGIDPADDSYYQESSKLATVVQDYFSKSAFDSVSSVPAKVITCAGMFYDLDEPGPFVQDLYNVLHDDGVIVLQMSYTPLMIEQMAFDNICHEHVYYWSLTSIQELFNKYNFKIVDCDLNDTNGGSMRVYIQKNTASLISFATAPLRDVFNFRVNALLEYEAAHYDLRSQELWDSFRDRLEKLRNDVVTFIREERSKGKIVWGYGASTKGNTLLQYFGLNENDIDAIAERSPYKYDLKTIGSNIPIKSEDEMRAAKPDYLLVLPWHFIGEFESREQEYLKSGGAFIVPCPVFKIIKAKD